MPAALFGITNDSLNLVVNLLILFLVVLWVALVAWTFFDARRRIADPILVASATAASLFPFLGTIVYTILRPPEFLADKRERELEIRASELRVRQLGGGLVPELRAPRGALVPALPELPGPDQGSLRVLWQADRPPVDDLPVLRDAAAQRGAAGAAPRERQAPLEVLGRHRGAAEVQPIVEGAGTIGVPVGEPLELGR